MRRRVFTYFALIVISALLLACFILFFRECGLFQWLSDTPYDTISGGKERKLLEDLRIRSNLELLLLSRLGVFFHGHFFGLVNWMMIPLGVYFVATIRRRQRWEIAVSVLFVSYVLLTALYGYYHWRYIFTLYPIAVCLVFLLINDLIARHPRVRTPVICVLIACVVLPLYYNYTPLVGKYMTSRAGAAVGTSGDPSEISGNGDRFPHDILRRVDSLEFEDGNGVVLEVEAPFLYYQTDAHLVSYESQSVKRIMRKNSKDAANMAKSLRNSLSIRYIVIPASIERIFRGSHPRIRTFVSMLEKECTLVASEKGYKLYRLN